MAKKKQHLKNLFNFDYHTQFLQEIGNRPASQISREIAEGEDDSMIRKVISGTRNASIENIAKILNWFGYDIVILIRPANTVKPTAVVHFTPHGQLSASQLILHPTTK